MDWKVTICEPTLDQSELEAVVKVVKSGWFTMGEVTKRFEADFSAALGIKHCFAVANGTAALHLANLALGIQTGDEVICPALTFVASANATRYTGAEVVFADSVSEHDLSIDPLDIEKQITGRTKAITVVHYGGFGCDMDAIMAIANKHNLKVIEDSAHAILATQPYAGKMVSLGTIGDVGCFSFFSNKNMMTGEGGMVVTNSDALADKIRLMRSHGMTSLTLERHKGHSSGYDVIGMGYNYRIDELRSAIGIEQLKKLPANNEKRRLLMNKYFQLLCRNANIILPYMGRNLDFATPHIMSIMIKHNYIAIRDALKANGIQSSKHYDLIPTFTAFGGYQFSSKIEYVNNLLTLPLHPLMTEHDVEYVCSVVNSL
ncbi:MAG: DegT/DnrJ/EryC1/StrS family aminotransferase [Candidatus Cloacimonas sp.]|jgi:dTDP-4-amino-4,6-dideoxygalactose transaminase|nr:DegT/DnrJ/EryC1/StrS family aminotransferase [Candidatus Cloacimonas sp.]